MTSQSAATVIQRWVDVAMGREKNLLNPKRSNVIAQGDRVFSYGAHFEMARFLRDKRGNIVATLTNGDTYSPTTSSHQRAVRDALSRTGIPSVTIPHRALSAAGIDLSSVRIVEVTADGWERKTITSTDQPEGSVWKDDLVLDEPARYGYMDADGQPWVDRFPSARLPFAIAYHVAQNGTLHGRGMQQWLVDTLRGRDEVRRGKRYGIVTPAVAHVEPRLYVNGRSHQTWTVHRNAVGGISYYSREYYRHWLGESLITGEVQYWTSRKCKACGAFGRRPGYEWGYVRGYSESGHTIADYSTSLACPDCDGTGVLRTRRTRRAYFLSGFDENETRPSYFFCELPRGAKPLTVSEAREALKPEAVRIAESLGRTVRRQGDVFAVPTELTLRDLRKQGATVSKGAFILGVNHRATEVAVLPDGLTFIRGTITHDPGQWRRPDHKRVTVGTAWHLAVKNTVPVVKR